MGLFSRWFRREPKYTPPPPPKAAAPAAVERNTVAPEDAEPDAETLRLGTEQLNREPIPFPQIERVSAAMLAELVRGVRRACALANRARPAWRRRYRDDGAACSGSCSIADIDNVRVRVDRGRSLGSMLVRMVNSKCEGRAAWCYHRAGVSRQVYSLIISKPGRQTTKRTVMQLAIGLQLNHNEAEELLASAGYAFQPSSYEDQAFSYCIDHGVYSIFDVNDLLVKGNCDPIDIQ